MIPKEDPCNSILLDKDWQTSHEVVGVSWFHACKNFQNNYAAELKFTD